MHTWKQSNNNNNNDDDDDNNSFIYLHAELSSK
jgi:hypothetical protein